MSTAKPAFLQTAVVTFEYAEMPYAPPTDAILGAHECCKSEEPAECASPIESVKEVDGSEEAVERMRRAFANGLEQGLLEGRRLEREAQTAALRTAEEQRIRQVADLINQFASERDRYLNQVEQETVKLALAVAARILRREALMDPLFLTGAVRVALGQLSGTTEVRLRVAREQFELWQDAISHLPNLAISPELLAGEGMKLGDCVIETALGSIDLGVRSQLSEIERGFFDNAGTTAFDRHGSTLGERGLS